MNRQSQQLVVASVVAFLTSGVITLAGLSAAQDTMQHSYTPPPDGGGTSYQQPSGSTSYQPSGGSTNYQQPMDYSGMSGQPSGNYQPSGGHQAPSGSWSTSWSENKYWEGPKDGEGYVGTAGQHPEGKGYQKDGAGFFPGKGGTTAPAGMGNDAHMGKGDWSQYSGKKGEWTDHGGEWDEGQAGSMFKSRKGNHGVGVGGGQHGVGVGGGQFGSEEGGDRDAFMEQMRDSLKGRRSEGHTASDEGEDVDVSDVENVGEWTPQDVAAFIKETKKDVKELGQEVKEVGADVKEVKKDITTANKAIDKADGDLSAKLEQFVDAVTDTHQEVAKNLDALPAAIADEKGELQEVLEAAYDDPDLQKYIKPLETLLQTCTKLENKVEKIETQFEKLPDLHA